MHKSKLILHVDGDNFFVACEVARFPHLKGKPVIVGEERGIASALSKEAKALGVTRGMPVFQIREKYPEVTILPAHFELYEQYNEKLYTVLSKYSHEVERYSIDECFAVLYESDIKKYQEVHKIDLLQVIKNDAEACLGITLSFGLAKTKTLAKIASKKEKPSGKVVITEENRISILKETSIGSVWGIGRAISAQLTSYNVHTAFDFIEKGSQFIQSNFGSQTVDTWYELKGELRNPVHTDHETQKSFQSTRSFGMSTKERSFLLSELSTHIEILTSRLRQQNLLTNSVSFFIKKNTLYNKYISSEINLDTYTDNPSDIYTLVKEEFENIFQQEENFGFKFKATGVSIYRIRPREAVQNDLFLVQSTKESKNKYLETVDELHRRFGDNSVYLLSSHESRVRREKIHESRNIKNKFIYGLPLPYMGEVS